MRLATWALAGLLAVLPNVVTAGVLITEPDAQRVGLTRQWFCQVNADRSRGVVRHVTMHKEMLFVQTEQAIVQAVEAETGRTVWSQQIGRPNYPSLAPAANDDVVAIVNGSKLYVVDRQTGATLWSRSVGSSPGAGAAITEKHVFVPMINGLVEAYDLAHPNKSPWSYRSFGRIFVEPIVVGKNVCWTTDKGYFYAASTDALPIVRLRLESRDAIESRPAYWPPYLYACSMDGFVYAVHEKSGVNDWKFTTGSSISRSPAAVDGAVYVSPDRGGMFKLDGLTGRELWFTPGIKHCVAVAPASVYACDKLNLLAVIDANTGRRTANLMAPEQGRWLMNTHTDRIYWLGDSGVLQCLHAVDQSEPLIYDAKVDVEKPAEIIQRTLDELPGKKPAKPAAEDGDEPAADDAAMEADTAEADDFSS